ncbi:MULTISPECIES: hypothetical protein [Chitinibacter]|uniref:hypothetical protein n=1 Tax=Chitinibacter TaxID=230666 RepID=UPI0003F6734B|nr:MULTISPECIES: hypothetical protein [Chitinibacter]
MSNRLREQQKLHLCYQAQLHRLQLQTQLRAQAQPAELLRSAAGNGQLWSLLLRGLAHWGRQRPLWSALGRGAKLMGVVLAVARLLRNK